MKKEEKNMLKNLASLSSLKKQEIAEIIESQSFTNAFKEICGILMIEGIITPKAVLLKYVNYCISESDNFGVMIEGLSRIISYINMEVNIDDVAYVIENSERVNNIIAGYLGRNITIYSLSKLLELPSLSATFIETYCDIHDINIVDDTMDDLSITDGISIYIKSIPDGILTREQEMELYIRYHNGDESAKNELIIHNLRLVLSIASRFTGRGLDFDDLIQAGNEGLMRAVEKFDATKGYKLSTYSTWWIRQGIAREIDNNSRSIRIPVHMLERIKFYKKVCADFSYKNGRLPNDDEVIDIMNISEAELKRLKKYKDDAVSLDTPVGEVEHGEQSTLGDFIEQSALPLPENYALDNSVKQQINGILEEKSKKTESDLREVEVLKLRNGFYDERVYTLEEIGKMYNVTRERIRQIEAKAYIKLKKNPTFRKLAEDMGITVPPKPKYGNLREEILKNAGKQLVRKKESN